MKKPAKMLVPALLILTIAALVFFAMRPKAMTVETGLAVSGALQETVEAEGETRAHERYTVAAPVSGRLMRIGLHDGDRVAANQEVAIINPTPLDKRERDAAAARVSAAESQLRAAGEQAAHDRAEQEQARRELARTEQLSRQGLTTLQALEQAATYEQRAARTLAAAEYRMKTATAQLREARAALISVESAQGGGSSSITLRAPKSGPVLRVLEKSERIVAAGTPLLLIGDPQKLEVVADVLSSDAVRISAGAAVTLDEWGGPQPLRGGVRLVEPYAFTKISALGIEEQRVNIIIDFCDPPGALGDGYRVMARIVTWSGDKAVKIPINALFRQGDNWCVFIVKNGRAVRQTVTVGHRNQTEAEIVSGVSEGETVVSHPSSQLDDGMRVRVR